MSDTDKTVMQIPAIAGMTYYALNREAARHAEVSLAPLRMAVAAPLLFLFRKNRHSDPPKAERKL